MFSSVSSVKVRLRTFWIILCVYNYIHITSSSSSSSSSSSLSYHQHGYPWPSLATPPYRSSFLAGPQGYIPYPHRPALRTFELVALHLLGHVKGSIRVHDLWARPCFSSRVLYIWFVSTRSIITCICIFTRVRTHTLVYIYIALRTP